MNRFFCDLCENEMPVKDTGGVTLRTKKTGPVFYVEVKTKQGRHLCFKCMQDIVAKGHRP